MKRVSLAATTPVDTGPSSKKRVRFVDVQAAADEPSAQVTMFSLFVRATPIDSCSPKSVRGFRLQRVDAQGHDTEAPVLVCRDDRLEVGRQFCVDRGYDVGKHITRVSRQHFCIAVLPGEVQRSFELQDKAANGTWINGIMVGKGSHMPLAHGDVVTVLYDEHEKPLLQFRFLLHGDADEQRAPTPPLSEGGDSDDERHEEVASPSKMARVDVSRTDPSVHVAPPVFVPAARLAASPDAPDEWFRRTAVTVTAGLVLLASAVAANWM